MNEKGMAYEEVVSPIVSARLKRVAKELRGKIPGLLRVSCSLRHISRDTYEATVSVDLAKAGAATVMARKESKNVFKALNEASKAVLRQVFNRKEKLSHRRHHFSGKLDLPLAS